MDRWKWVVIDVGVIGDTSASHSENFFFFQHSSEPGGGPLGHTLGCHQNFDMCFFSYFSFLIFSCILNPNVPTPHVECHEENYHDPDKILHTAQYGKYHHSKLTEEPHDANHPGGVSIFSKHRYIEKI